MAPVGAAQPIRLPALRKRKLISYAEAEMSPDPMGEDEASVASDDDDDTDNDDTDEFHPGKKCDLEKRKPAKKRRRTIAPSKPKKEKPFRFLELPAELRDIIYNMALTDNCTLYIIGLSRSFRRIARRWETPAQLLLPRPVYNPQSFAATRTSHEVESQQQNQLSVRFTPNLLAVNHQIHDEAIGVLYGQSIICEDSRVLHDFLAPMSSNNLKRLRHITIADWGNGRGALKAADYYALNLLGGATNLKTFTIASSPCYMVSPVRLARRFYRDGFRFLEAYGLANGGKSAGVELIQLHEECFDYRELSQQHRLRIGASTDPAKNYEAFKEELCRLLER